jgi:cell division ATPase FtsA
MASRPIVAIDLGSTKVACVVGQATENGQGFEIVGSGLASYPSPSSAWPGDPSLIARVVEQALEEAGCAPSLDRAIVALTHPALSHHRVTASIDVADEPVTVRSRELQRLKAQAIGQALGIDQDALLLEAVAYRGNGFDGVRDPRGLVATKLSGTFQLIGLPLAAKRAATQALEALGLEAEQFLYSLQASAASCIEEPLRSKRVLLVDLGGCCADLAIVDQGCLTRTLSIPVTLEGVASPKRLIDRHLRDLEQGLRQLMKGEVMPETAIVTGRGALIDGVVEWVECATELNAVLGRSPRASRLGDLSRQVALSAAIGLLELRFRGRSPSPARSSRFVNRLLDRTKTLLIEYF